jgi:hypothetical protein
MGGTRAETREQSIGCPAEQKNKEAETAVKRLIEVKDVHAAICGAVFSDLGSSKSKYSGQITRQYLLASAAFVIQNPDRAGDAALTNISAVQSVLALYTAILQAKPEARMKSLAELVEEQNAGTLQSTIHKKCGQKILRVRGLVVQSLPRHCVRPKSSPRLNPKSRF